MSLSAQLMTAGAILWGMLACGLPFARGRLHMPLLCVLVLTGVPMLGWLTYVMGPGVGVIGFALGLVMVIWPQLVAHRPSAAPRRPLRPGAPE